MPRKTVPTILYVTGHLGTSGKPDGRVFRCTLHTEAGGADDGTFRPDGLAWHAQDGGCDVAADFLNIPVADRKRGAASRQRMSDEERQAALVERARRKALGQ
jgi:hypothetical protein